MSGTNGESLLSGEGSALSLGLAAARVWDVTDENPWKSLMGVPIVATHITWDHWSTGWINDAPEMWCQAACTVRFDDQREIFVALGERDFATGRLRASADSLVVFWSRKAATEAGLRILEAGAQGSH